MQKIMQKTTIEQPHINFPASVLQSSNTIARLWASVETRHLKIIPIGDHETLKVHCCDCHGCHGCHGCDDCHYFIPHEFNPSVLGYCVDFKRPSNKTRKIK